MAFFGLFKKKSVQPEQEQLRPLPQELGSRADFSMPQPDQLLSPQIQQEHLLSKDIQVLISKMDLVNARLENINKRLENMERFIYSQNQQPRQENQIDQEIRKRW